MSNGRFVLLLFMLLTVAALLAQLFIDFSTVNLASASIAFASSMAVLMYLLWTPAIHTHPVSTFALFGFCATTQMGALLGQSAMLTSLSDNLRQPMQTFAMLAGVQLLALLTHTGYRWVLNPANDSRESLPRQLLRGLGLYQAPGTGTLWFMGYVGLMAFVIGGGRDGTFFKVLQGMSFLTWAPFLIPMYLLEQGRSYCNPRRQYPHLVFFVSLVVLLGLAANARQVMLSGFVTIALFGLLLTLRSTQPVRASQVIKLGALGLVLAAVSIPLSDLATAMSVARKARGFISAPQMVQETFRYYGQPDVLQAEREKLVSATNSQYDEFYFANPLLARLVETKFHDNALYFASTLSPSDVDQLAETSAKMVAVLLPQPVINQLGWKIDKNDYEFSMGDYLAHLSYGGPLGGYRTGSMLGQGNALFGAGFVAFYVLVCLLAFSLFDLLSHRRGQGQVLLSAVAMLAIWKLFQNGLTGESLQSWLGLFVRALPQNIFMFLVFALVGRAFGSLFGSAAHRSPQEQPAHQA